MKYYQPIPLLIIIALALVSQAQPTILSFIIQHQQPSKEEILELTIQIQAFDKSLQTAMALAKEKAQNLKHFEEQICSAMVKDKSQCRHSAIIGKPQISPKYSQKKKEMVFEGVKVVFEVVIVILNPLNFGKLVDKILTLQGFVISKIEWKPEEEQEDDTFLQQGFQKSKLMCKQLGLTLKRFVSVEQIREDPPKPEPQAKPQEGEQQEEEQAQEEQLQQQQEEISEYRLTVQCIKRPSSSKK